MAPFVPVVLAVVLVNEPFYAGKPCSGNGAVSTSWPRFPAYCYDKLVCGLIDSHLYVGDPLAFSILERTTDTALPHLPGKAVEHGQPWRQDHPSVGYTWDEPYTNSENLFIAYQRGAGKRYRDLGIQYLHDQYYDPLAEGRNVLAGRHAYSYVNSLSSAMQAYLRWEASSICGPPAMRSTC
jgi:hypothetical protein